MDLEVYYKCRVRVLCDSDEENGDKGNMQYCKRCLYFSLQHSNILGDLNLGAGKKKKTRGNKSLEPGQLASQPPPQSMFYLIWKIFPFTQVARHVAQPSLPTARLSLRMFTMVLSVLPGSVLGCFPWYCPFYQGQS